MFYLVIALLLGAVPLRRLLKMLSDHLRYRHVEKLIAALPADERPAYIRKYLEDPEAA